MVFSISLNTKLSTLNFFYYLCSLFKSIISFFNKNTMIYDKHIDKTEDELRNLRDVFAQDDVVRFIDGLESGRINSEEKVIKFTNFIRTSDGLTQLEYSRLKQLLDEGFIEKFATNYNKRYSTCHMLMDKMSSSISRGLLMLEKLCEKKRSKGKSKSKRKVVENSKMGNSPYNGALWGLEYHMESVHVLYNEIRDYEEHLKLCIDLCLHIIEEVAYIKSHSGLCLFGLRRSWRQAW